MPDKSPHLHDRVPILQRGDFESLLHQDSGPCVTLYMPCDHEGNQGNSNRIRFKGLIRQAAASLASQDVSKEEANELLRPLWQLEADHDFWRNQRVGLVVFFKPNVGKLRLYRLNRALPERAIVANSFHVKPLLRLVQDSGRFQVLCVSMKRVALYEGTRDEITEVQLHSKVPANMAEAIGEPDHVTKSRRSQLDFTESDSKDNQIHRYFRRLDDAIWEHHSRQANIPLVLAALPEYHSNFQSASHNQHLLEQGIERDPFKEIEPHELAELAWQCVQPDIESRMTRIADRYESARANDLASDDLHEIAQAAAYGRVEELLVQADRQVGGSFNEKNGEVELRRIDDPQTDDVLDDIAEVVLRRDGHVTIVPEDKMPSNMSGLCAIYRYPDPRFGANKRTA